MRYYRLMDELFEPEHRWFLNGLKVSDEDKISFWEFLTPSPIELATTESLTIKVREKGISLDFTFADFEIIIVNERTASLLRDEDCQLLPIEIDGINNGHSYFVVIILNSIDCLDEERSRFEKWEQGNPIRPDLAGNYKSIYKLFIDGTKIMNNEIFRLGKYDNVIVINDYLKNKFERAGISGIKFREVT